MRKHANRIKTVPEFLAKTMPFGHQIITIIVSKIRIPFLNLIE